MKRRQQKGRCPVKCSDARHLIHLSVGDDNLPDEEQALGEHLHTCSECRAYNAGMVDAMQVLHDFRDSTVVETELSVWDSVQERIENRQSMALSARQPTRQFHGGIVTLCACSLVLAFFTIVQNLPVNNTVADGTQLPGHFIDVSTGSPTPAAPTFSGRIVPIIDANQRLIGFQHVNDNGQVSPFRNTQLQTDSQGMQSF